MSTPLFFKCINCGRDIKQDNSFCDSLCHYGWKMRQQRAWIAESNNNKGDKE